MVKFRQETLHSGSRTVKRRSYDPHNVNLCYLFSNPGGSLPEKGS